MQTNSIVSVFAAATQKPVAQVSQELAQPLELSTEELDQVAGGSPNGTWALSPNGTW